MLPRVKGVKLEEQESFIKAHWLHGHHAGISKTGLGPKCGLSKTTVIPYFVSIAFLTPDPRTTSVVCLRYLSSVIYEDL